MHDNPLVPNAIERPFERAVGGDRGPVGTRSGIIDRPGIKDGPGDRPGVIDHPSDISRSVTASTTSTDTRQMDLFPDEELVGYRTRWESIQTGFVDEPRAAVEQADALVSQVVTRLTERVYARTFNPRRTMDEG